jgi:hypothetical protein
VHGGSALPNLPGFAGARPAGRLSGGPDGPALAGTGLATVVTRDPSGAGAGRGVALADALAQPNTERDAEPYPESDPNPNSDPDAVTEPDVHANRHPNRSSNSDLDAGAVAQLRR